MEAPDLAERLWNRVHDELDNGMDARRFREIMEREFNRSPELAAIRVALESVDAVEGYAGKFGHRQWAERASVWLYPGQAWGIMEPEMVKVALEHLNALTGKAP